MVMEPRFSFDRLRNCVRHRMADNLIRMHFFMSLVLCFSMVPVAYAIGSKLIMMLYIVPSLLSIGSALVNNKRFEALIPATVSEKFASFGVVALFLIAIIAAVVGGWFLILSLFGPMGTDDFINVPIPHAIVMALMLMPVTIVVGNMRCVCRDTTAQLATTAPILIGVGLVVLMVNFDFFRSTAWLLIMAAIGVAFWIWAYLGYKHREVI